MSRTVPGSGPFNAPLLFVGEAPGRTEVSRGLPFVGETGQAVRRELGYVGMEVTKYDARDVRFTNVVPYNPGRIVGPHHRDKLVMDNWDNISADLARMDPRVIVACGGTALRRLTGLTDITDEHGGVIPASDLPSNAVIHGAVLPLRLPSRAIIIPCLHPAGIMQTKIRAEWIQCRTVLRRAAEYALGKEYVPDRIWPMHVTGEPCPTFEAFTKMLAESRVLVIDTEFDEETKVPHAVQVLGDSDEYVAYLFKPEQPMLGLLQEAIKRPDTWKVSHYNPAEIESLARVGVDATTGPWWDTLLGYATLYPDVNVGLNHCTLFYCDNERNWKDLGTDDDWYRAKDVRCCYRCFVEQRNELATEGMMDLFIDEVMPAGHDCYELEVGGLKVDPERQREIITANRKRVNELEQELVAWVGTTDTRVKRTMKEFAALLEEAGGVTNRCTVHPKYDGVRKKRWADKDLCTCEFVYMKAGDLVEREPCRPFVPNNNHDLRWLLYKHLKLPVQKNRDTGKPTANADAVQRIIVRMMDAHAEVKQKSKYYRDDAAKISENLRKIKEAQHLEKLESTFLKPPVDEDGYAHPEMRPWGTGTGRPASGGDDDVGKSQYSFNALNIRKGEMCRAIFVPGAP